MKTRADQLAEVGLAKIGDPEQRLLLSPLVRAVAAMIAEATPAPKPKTPRNPEARADYAVGKTMIEWLQRYAPDHVAYDPVQPQTILTFGKAVRDASLEPKDMVQLAQYIRGGAFHWMDTVPALSYIARNLADLVAKARRTKGPKPSAEAPAPRRQD